MGKAAEQLKQDRAARDEAKGQFDVQLAQVKHEIQPETIAGKLTARTKHALGEAVEVADQNRGVIAGTLAALAIWYLRKPIKTQFDRMRGKDNQKETNSDRDQD